MSNLIASQKVMQHYLQALLTEDDSADQVALEEQKKQQLNALLAQAVVTKPAPAPTPQAKVVTAATTEIDGLTALKQKFAEAEQAQQLQQRDVPVYERIAVSATVMPEPIV